MKIYVKRKQSRILLRAMENLQMQLIYHSFVCLFSNALAFQNTVRHQQVAILHPPSQKFLENREKKNNKKPDSIPQR